MQKYKKLEKIGEGLFTPNLRFKISIDYWYCRRKVAARRVGRGVRWVRTHPPRAEKVRLERSKDELTNAKDESFLLICQRTQLFTLYKTYPRLLIT